MIGAVDQMAVMRVSLFETGKLGFQLGVDGERRGIPAAVGGEPAVEDVEAGEVLDREMLAHELAQLIGREEMRIHLHAAAIGELDGEAVVRVILAEGARFLDRVRHRSWACCRRHAPS